MINTPYIYVPCNAGNGLHQINKSNAIQNNMITLAGGVGAAVNLSSGYLWVSSTYGYLWKINLDSIGTYSSYYVGASIYGVCLDKNGKIWVAVGGPGNDNRVRQYNDDGTLMNTYTVGTFPYGICCDCNNNIWVTNNANNSISKISNGTVTTYSGFSSPYGIISDYDGNILVACYGGSNIKKVNQDGSITATYNTSLGPYGLTIDSNNNIWVSNLGQNSSISKFNSSGSLVTNYTIIGSGPAGICVDDEDNIWVANNGSAIIEKVSNSASRIGATNITNNPIGIGDMSGYHYQHFVLKSDVSPIINFNPWISMVN